MITAISTKNFKGHKEIRLNFKAGLNTILGKNEVGKTTICDAIAFVFYGCDQYGSKNPDHLIMFGEEACEVALATDKALFTRRKVRGQSSTVTLTRSGMPPIKMTQSELTTLLGISFDVFASFYSVGYFMDLPQDKKLEVLGQIIKIDRKALLLKLVPDAVIGPKIKFEDLKRDAQTVANERRVLQNQLAGDVGSLSQVETQMKEFKQDLAALNLDEVKAEIGQLTAKADLFGLYNKELTEYKFALAVAKEREGSQEKLAAEKIRVELELKSLEWSHEKRVVELKERRKQVNKEHQALRDSVLHLPPLPTTIQLQHDETTCTRCGGVVSPKMRESIEAEKTKLINDYNKEARRIADHNSAVDKSTLALAKEDLEINLALDTLLKEENERCFRVSALRARLKDLDPEAVKVPPPPTKPEGDEKEIVTKLGNLKAKYHAYQLFQQKRDQLEARDKMFRQSVEQKTNQIKELKKVEDALNLMPEVELKQTLELLKTPGILINFVEGEFIVSDERLIPYQSLSMGRKMKVSLEIAKTLQRLCPRAPQFYFVDNVDLMDDYVGILPGGPTQVFIAKVDPAVTELLVI